MDTSTELTDTDLRILLQLDQNTAQMLHQSGEKKIWLQLCAKLLLLQTEYATPLTLNQLRFGFYAPFRHRS